MNKGRRHEIRNMANGDPMLDRNNNSKPKPRINPAHTIRPTLTKGIVPYDTGKVKIGIYYEPKPNYYNHDQDWVQKALLGIETTITTDVVVFCLLYSVLLYAVMGLITRSFYE